MLDTDCFIPVRATNSAPESKKPDDQSGFFTSVFTRYPLNGGLTRTED